MTENNENDELFKLSGMRDEGNEIVIAQERPKIDFSRFVAPPQMVGTRKDPIRNNGKPRKRGREEDKNPQTPPIIKIIRHERKTTTTTTTAMISPSPSFVLQSASPRRTISFAPCGNTNLSADLPPPHTLILGTHPSVRSLQQNQYYAHAMNAFWWIAGDCLGFRRDSGISPSTGQPYQFTRHLRYDNVLSYEEQLQTLLKHGFCLWDIVESCQRPGSLDQDITLEVPNDVPALCDRHKTIQRIVVANGGTATNLFCKHFGNWMEKSTVQGSVLFGVGSDSISQQNFGKMGQKLNRLRGAKLSPPKLRTISLISAMSVSPAAASFSYLEKRNFWETHVYQPGLLSYQQWKNEQQEIVVKQTEDISNNNNDISDPQTLLK